MQGSLPSALQGTMSLDIREYNRKSWSITWGAFHDSSHSTNLTGFAKRLARVPRDISNSQRR